MIYKGFDNMIGKRFYDPKTGFKVKVTDIVTNRDVTEIRYKVKPYKVVEDRWYVFNNSYIVPIGRLISLS